MADAHAAPHHDYHLVNPSPWPLVSSMAACIMFIGAVVWMKGLVPADAGPIAANFLAEASALLREPPRRRQVAISVAPSFASKWLMPRMDDFHASHPEIELWISADMEPADLTEGKVDLAVRYGPGDYPGLTVDRLMTETVLPVCAPALMAGEHPIRKPADLVMVDLGEFRDAMKGERIAGRVVDGRHLQRHDTPLVPTKVLQIFVVM